MKYFDADLHAGGLKIYRPSLLTRAIDEREADIDHASNALDGKSTKEVGNQMSISIKFMKEFRLRSAGFISTLEDARAVVVATLLLVVAVAWAGPRRCTATSSWTGVRAVLALLILLEHTGRQPIACGGSFFLLSGCILAHASAGKVNSLRDYVQFQLRRLIRIFPAFWVLMCVRVFKWPELVSTPSAFVGAFFAFQSWGYQTHNYLWFVSDIVAAYLAMPLLESAFVKLGTRERLSATFSVAACCYTLQLIAAAYVLYSSPVEGSSPTIYVRSVAGFPVAFYVFPIMRLPQFGLGMLVAHGLQALRSGAEMLQGTEAGGHGPATLLETPQGNSCSSDRPFSVGSTQKAPKLVTNVPSSCEVLLARASDVVACLMLAAILASKAASLYSYPADAFAEVANRLNLGSPLFALFLFSLAGSGSAASVTKFTLTLRPVLVIGEWSYGFYLWHPMVASYLGSWSLHSKNVCSSQLLFLTYVYSAFLSFLSFYVVEEPARRIARF